MTGLAILAAAALAPMLLISVWNLAASSRLHSWAPRATGPLVSVLVPARDEAANLRVLVPALLRTRYEPVEIVVMDDASRDETLAVARGYAANDSRVRVAEGLDLPHGWMGKNWACHQLSAQARGDILIFCDADVVAGPDAVGRTVAALDDAAAGALTALPRDTPGGWLERAVIPLITKLPIAALLPLPLVRRSASPALSAGNGQWFAWRREAYGLAGGHRSVCDDPLEDVRLARRAKAAGVTLLAVPAPRDLAVRMYRSRAALREGFAKNLYPLLGRHGAGLMAGVILFTTVTLLPLIVPLIPGSGPYDLVPLAMLLGVRVTAAILFREHPTSVLLHPVGAPVATWLALESWRRHRDGTVTWRRRALARAEAP
jgi:chlorobactene glucosyltransferase